MTEIAAPVSLPGIIVLATDLSARCDRALDRAAQLASAWQARLLAANVIDATAAPDLALAWARGDRGHQAILAAHAQLQDDLAGTGIDARLHTAHGDDVAEAVGAIVVNENAGLVVTGVARSDPEGRFILGSTVNALIRALRQPVLVVRRRAHGEYRHIVVVSDYTDVSRHAARTAAAFFPGRELTVFHARGLSLGDLSRQSLPSSHAHDELTVETGHRSGVPQGVAMRAVIVRGGVAQTLTRYVRQHEVDLVVIGARCDGAFMRLLLGSTAETLLDWLPCDVLVVKEAGEGSAA